MSRSRRRSRFAAITDLWPLGMTLVLLALTVGLFWLMARDLRFERRPLGEPTAQARK